MSSEAQKASLKRVLLGVKARARAMRKGNFDRRMSPPKPPLAEEEIGVLEIPEELMEAPKETKASEAAETKAKEASDIRKLLARS